MARARGRRGRGSALWIAIAAAVAVVAIAAFVGAARATDRPSFCRTCHEMEPYYQAWKTGPHAKVECVDCHVAPGTPARLSHKFVALGELWMHLTSKPTFPRPSSPRIANAWCARCHADVKVRAGTTSRFSHALHEKQAQCWECHTKSGHDVTLASLQAAGVLAPNARTIPASVAGTSTGTPRPGHIAVSCTRCHDQSKTACATCHKPPHVDRGPCDRCHRTGRAFSFVHPTSGDCGACHKPKHPNRGACTTCHRVGKTWTFYHPASNRCAQCHKPKHQPRGDCTLCHRYEQRWVFHHPSSKACTRCHTAPANHFGGNCPDCHNPSTPFAKTRFNHPSTGAPHSSTSFACAKCHPSGPPAVSCTCHGGGRPSGD